MATRSVDIILNARDRASPVVQNATGRMMGSLGRLAGAFTLAFAARALVRFTADSIRLYNEQAKQERMLAATLRSTGHAAGFTTEEMVKYAGQLQRLSGVGDEVILQGQGMLATFTKIGKETFNDATLAAMNMSARLGTDLKASIIQVGKALQDPILGITALRRAGVNFDETQKEIIKNLVKSGDHLGAQKMILAELKTEFEGAAAAGRTSTGSFAAAWGDVKDAFGGLLASTKTFNDSLDQATRKSEQLSAVLSDASGRAGQPSFLDRWLSWGQEFPVDLQAAAQALEKIAPKVTEAFDAQAADAAEKLADGVEKLTAKLRDQQATFGMTAIAAEIHRQKMAGATDEQLAQARGLAASIEGMEGKAKAEKNLAELIKKHAAEVQAEQEKLRDAGISVWESVRTPLEAYNDEVERLNELLRQGVISQETFSRAEKKAREGLPGQVSAAAPSEFKAITSAPLVSRFLTMQPGSANTEIGVLRELRALTRQQVKLLQSLDRKRVEVELN